MTATILPCDHPATAEMLPPTVLRVRRTFIDVAASSTAPSPCCNTTPAWFAPGLAEWNGPYTPASSRCADARNVLHKTFSTPITVGVPPERGATAPAGGAGAADPFLQQKPVQRRDPGKYMSSSSMMSIPETEECMDFDDGAEMLLDRPNPHKLRIPVLRDGATGQIWTAGTPQRRSAATPISTPLFGETSKLTTKLPLGSLLGAVTPMNGTSAPMRQSPVAYAALSNDQALEALRSMIQQRQRAAAAAAAPQPQPVRLDLASCVAPPLAPAPGNPFLRCDASFASTASTSDEPHTPPPPVPEWQPLPPPPLRLEADFGPMPSYSSSSSSMSHYGAELRSNNVNYSQHQLSSCPIRANEIAEQTMREELVRGYRAALAAGDPATANRYLDAALKLGVANSID